VRYRELGSTGIRVSTISFGGWAIAGGFNWGPQDRRDSLFALRAAFDCGVTLFDSAEGYGEGRSEQLIGEALSGVRDRIVLATKVLPHRFAPDDLRAACEQSLRNLRTDRIDLYQLHWPRWDVPIEETLAGLESLRAAGKIRAYGVSNFGKRDLEDGLRAGFPVSADQVAYSLLFRAVEFEILPACRQGGVSVLCYSPLLQGLLTGKFRSADEVPADRARTRHFSGARPRSRHGEAGLEAETFAAVAEIGETARGLGLPMADVALAWVLAQPGVASAIVGGRNAAQAAANTRVADLDLPEEALRRLSDITDPLKRRMGPNADLWQSESRIR
jgi:aryl-alcohol dehydrogenase-like predicted oxidoreductase